MQCTRMVQCLNLLEKIMSLKQRIKFKTDRDRGTSHAVLRSSGPKQRPDKGSDEARRSEVESTELDGVHPDDMIRFEEHSEEEYRAHLKKFFKGNDET